MTTNTVISESLIQKHLSSVVIKESNFFISRQVYILNADFSNLYHVQQSGC